MGARAPLSHVFISSPLYIYLHFIKYPFMSLWIKEGTLAPDAVIFLADYRYHNPHQQQQLRHQYPGSHIVFVSRTPMVSSRLR